MHYIFLSVLFGTIEVLLLERAFSLFDPVLFMPVFYLFAFIIVLFPLLRKRRSIDFTLVGQDKLNLALYIIFGAVGNAFWFIGLYIIGSGTVVLIGVLQRIFLIIYASSRMSEKLTTSQLISSMIIMLSCAGFASELGSVGNVGVFICSISYIMFGLSDIFQKKISQNVDWSVALTIRQFIQFIFFSLICVIYVSVNDKIKVMVGFEWVFIGYALMASISGAVIGKWAHYQSIKYIGLGRTTIFEQFKVLTVFFGAVLISGQALTEIQMLLGVVILFAALQVLYVDQKIRNNL